MAAPHFPAKDALRRAMKARRAAATPDAGAARALCKYVLAQCGIAPGAVVAGYWPIGGEMDVRPLLAALIGLGHEAALPETPPRGRPLAFRAWRPGAPMVAERFGTQRPDGALARPQVLLVPLLAFDARCNRLGYGGGYYDRTIAADPGVRTIGAGFSWQQVDAVPVLPHDMALDAVATERGVLFRPEG